jgi:hypothetical protein
MPPLRRCMFLAYCIAPCTVCGDDGNIYPFNREFLAHALMLPTFIFLLIFFIKLVNTHASKKSSLVDKVIYT